MMLRVAWRSLMTRPIRAAVLAAGFGFGIGVMAALLGVGQVILEQAHAPALKGGGDLVMYGPFGSVSSARFLISSVFAAPDVAPRVRTASPSRSARLFLMTPAGPVAVAATAGIPSLEQSLGGEVSAVASWVDAPGDERWRHPDRGEVLRAMDRFHVVPDVNAHAKSWAEWLYFNGRSRDGRVRVYLTFLVGPRATTAGKRRAGVRLQLERDGRSTNYSAADGRRRGAGARPGAGSRYRRQSCPARRPDVSNHPCPARSQRRHRAGRATGTVVAAGVHSRRRRLGVRLRRAGVIGRDARRRCESAARR